ncbi:MAG TPA: RidA family protein [Acidimicrobiales bacterium]|nr:RidA family protein [Acidimicrobiales bacterium]
MTDPATPAPRGPYSPIARAGGWLVTAGQLGMRDGRLLDGVVEQTRQALDNIRVLLESEGATLGDVVKTTVLLADIADWPAMNEPYVKAFGEHRPARTAFAAAGLPAGARVEIEAWAYVGEE